MPSGSLYRWESRGKIWGSYIDSEATVLLAITAAEISEVLSNILCTQGLVRGEKKAQIEKEKEGVREEGT